MRKQKVRTIEELTDTVRKDFRRWREIYTKGCPSDPTYKDGVNLDLVRNHIIYDLNVFVGREDIKPWELPDEYYYPIPPKFPYDFMAVDRYMPVAGKLEKSTKTLSYNEVVSAFDWRSELMWADLLIESRGVN